MRPRKTSGYTFYLLVLSALLILPFLLGAAPARSGPPAEPPFARGRILVKFEPDVTPAEKAALHRAHGGRPIEVIPGIEVEVVGVPERAEEALAAAYARHPRVAYAEPDYVATALDMPNDPNYVKQWGLNNIGQVYKDNLAGMNDADIDAPEAWDVPTSNAGIVIAILDSGIDRDHEDLAGKVVTNRNFSDSSTDDDLYGHGTHVAGIAAAATHNGIGVAGVCRNCALMNVKVLNDRGMGAYSWIAAGIRYAADTSGVKVINMSLGGNIKSRTLEDAVKYAWGKGVVLVAAAGNDGSSRATYPAQYSNCIAVAATDARDRKASFSQFGKWVDVAAPGVDIFSTFPNHSYAIGKALSYDYGSGTSMATPYVAGLAGLVWSTNLSTNQAVRDRIESTTDRIPGTGSYWTYGRINACRAVNGTCS